MARKKRRRVTCECGLPNIPGTDMCRRCAMLDYGATSQRGIRPRGTAASVIACLRDMPGGASTAEIHACTGEPHYRNTQRVLQTLTKRGRVRKFDCGDLVAGVGARCYELDDPDRPRRRRRRR